MNYYIILYKIYYYPCYLHKFFSASYDIIIAIYDIHIYYYHYLFLALLDHV